VADIDALTWQRDVDQAKAAINKRFPNLVCLRCREERFMLRLWPDESLVPGVASPEDNRVVELICENCGFQEKHVVRLLTADQTE
jgi:hypothetical protein